MLQERNGFTTMVGKHILKYIVYTT